MSSVIRCVPILSVASIIILHVRVVGLFGTVISRVSPLIVVVRIPSQLVVSGVKVKSSSSGSVK